MRLSVDRVRIHLKRAQLTYQRTIRSLRHKQDPVQVAARTAELEGLQNGPVLRKLQPSAK